MSFAKNVDIYIIFYGFSARNNFYAKITYRLGDVATLSKYAKQNGQLMLKRTDPQRFKSNKKSTKISLFKSSVQVGKCNYGVSEGPQLKFFRIF